MGVYCRDYLVLFAINGRVDGMLKKIITVWCTFSILVLVFRVILLGSWIPYLVAEAVGLLLVLGVLSYFYSVAMKWYTTGAEMASVVSDPKQGIGLDFEDFTIERAALIKIKGWYIPENPKIVRHSAVVYSHGFGNCREVCGEVTYRQMRMLHECGCAVFTFDYPYGNRDDAHRMTAGVEESKDLIAVVQYARSKGYKFITVFGYSFGGGTALLSASEGGLDALFLDSAFIANISVLVEKLERFAGLPRGLSRFLLPPFWSYYMGRNHPHYLTFVSKRKPEGFDLF